MFAEAGLEAIAITDHDNTNALDRCMAAGKNPETTAVREIMTGQVLSVEPETDAGTAAHLMGRRQVRRLPVVENGILCGMVSLADLAKREESVLDAADALGDIASNISGGDRW